jgi:hypothetical protein
MRSHTNRNQKPTKEYKKSSVSGAVCAGSEVLSIDSAGKKISLKPGASLDQLPPTGAQQFLFQVIVHIVNLSPTLCRSCWNHQPQSESFESTTPSQHPFESSASV